MSFQHDVTLLEEGWGPSYQFSLLQCELKTAIQTLWWTRFGGNINFAMSSTGLLSFPEHLTVNSDIIDGQSIRRKSIRSRTVNMVACQMVGHHSGLPGEFYQTRVVSKWTVQLDREGLK